VSESELRSVYLLTGGDRPKIRRALERLRSRFGPESVETVSAESVDGPGAVAALNSLGLFAGDGGRLVIVEEVERWKKADEEAVASYLADPAPCSRSSPPISKARPFRVSAPRRARS
jgi:DNA polymerase III delta subunit